MNRLRDQPLSTDPVANACADLVRNAGEPDDLDAMQARVRQRLAEPPRRVARPTSTLRPAIAFALVLGLISLSAAMVLLAKRAQPPRSTAQANGNHNAVASAPAHTRSPDFVAPAPSSSPLESVPAATIPSPSKPASSPSLRAKNAAPTVEAKIPSAAEAKLVMDGVTALRIEHDAARAGTLFTEYLATYPHGALYEEALAYAIEAAVAREADEAVALAERYLRRFPKGRFRAVAEHAKDRIDD